MIMQTCIKIHDSWIDQLTMKHSQIGERKFTQFHSNLTTLISIDYNPIMMFKYKIREIDFDLQMMISGLPLLEEIKSMPTFLTIY